MMPEISLNILDVAENSVRAGASLIEIEVSVQTEADTLTVVIKDNGSGMSAEQVEKALDPFYTTRTTRGVGLGVPFFKQAAESAGGSLSIMSEEGNGTIVKAVFGLSHIDRMPLGDISSTIYTLVAFNQSVHFVYTYINNGAGFVLDTQEIKKILGEGVSLLEPEVSDFIKDFLQDNKAQADMGADI